LKKHFLQKFIDYCLISVKNSFATQFQTWRNFYK